MRKRGKSDVYCNCQHKDEQDVLEARECSEGLTTLLLQKKVRDRWEFKNSRKKENKMKLLCERLHDRLHADYRKEVKEVM